MDKRKCGKCALEKPLADFYLRKKGPRAGKYYERCKTCFKDRGRRYYHENHERQLRLAKLRFEKYLQERRKLLVELKNKPCFDCGRIYPPWVMDFDHRGEDVKLGNISHYFLRGMWKIDKLMLEIAKCDLVCSNCHRKRTYSRGVRNYDKILQEMKQEGYLFHWEK